MGARRAFYQDKWQLILKEGGLDKELEDTLKPVLEKALLEPENYLDFLILGHAWFSREGRDARMTMDYTIAWETSAFNDKRMSPYADGVICAYFEMDGTLRGVTQES